MVDVLCLDQQGRLVLLEAKNEKTTRAAIGQALEYLSVLDGATVEDLSVEAGEDVAAKFLGTFEVTVPSPLPRDARVLVAAPDFLPSATVVTTWLNNRLSDVTVTMLRVQQDDNGFRLEEFVGHDFRRARSIKNAGPAISERGRAYCILQTGPEPVLWHVGRPRVDGTIVLPSQKALTQNALRVDPRRFLFCTEGIDGLDLSLQGTVWRRQGRDERATVLGRVRAGGRWQVVLCREDGKGRVGIRARDETHFRAEWGPGKEAPPSWTDLARRLRTP